MKETIKSFASESFPAALHAFYKTLGIPYGLMQDAPFRPQDILGDSYRPSIDAHTLIGDIYTTGLVTDEVFNKGGDISYSDTKQKLAEISNAERDYDSLLLLGVQLKARKDGALPTRTQIADITRAVNRKFSSLPVTIVFRYADGEHIALANVERVPYKRATKEGERAGKVSLLKDIDINTPHRGHLSILNQISIPRSGPGAVKSFRELYFYWQSVFSIAVLNKAFYSKIIAWFNTAVATISIPGQDKGSEKHKDFTVRLIARLIFIWFLKELKVVDEQLLIPIWDNGKLNDLIRPDKKGSSYYKFVLQSLFFNALNCEQDVRKRNAYEVYSDAFTDATGIRTRIAKAPYLNGGLFDIHPNDWCDAKAVNNGFVVPDALFLDPKTGLNSILAQFKFTIAENTPQEEEIAVDPEMLGRIFENLLAEQSTDTQEAARKAAGAFYTPRPVVAYMCRSVLHRHLNVELTSANGKAVVKKMLATTVLDPACGSGAFPMGMLEEMMQVLETVDPKGNIWIGEMLQSKDPEFLNHIGSFITDGQIRYVKKLGLLRACLFGTDLLEYAVEITKLRCWLSLIVEQRVDMSKDNYNLKPLPNLDFKFYKKNTLFYKYNGADLNQLIQDVNPALLEELDNLEHQYFITASDNQGTKEGAKKKINALLERLVDRESERVQKELNRAIGDVATLQSSGAAAKLVNAAKKKSAAFSTTLGDLAEFRDAVKDYLIERLVFPGIFSPKSKAPGFSIVIGNPPYVNTKLINKLGISEHLKEDYGYTDDLYNHFTLRGLQLVQMGGLLSYITSDTFLTLQTKRNMRSAFLGLSGDEVEDEGEEVKISSNGTPARQIDIFGKARPVQLSLTDASKDDTLFKAPGAYRLLEVINTPKAFAALVDTAIFTVVKSGADDAEHLIDYTDLRYPSAASFGISEDEWKSIRKSKENMAGWERVLDKTFSALHTGEGRWQASHLCGKEQVMQDADSRLLRYRLSGSVYRSAIGQAIFSPTPYNCQILERIIQPARSVFDEWWKRIETSKKIEGNRALISEYTDKLKPGNITLVGLITDGGQGLATGDNGSFVGYREGHRYASRCRQMRPGKIWEAMKENRGLTRAFPVLAGCENVADVEEILQSLSEETIWELMDGIKAKYSLRAFGKGFMYRIIPENLVFNVGTITDKQKLTGIKGKRCYVPYDKGDREGNRWYLETPYLVDWSEGAVELLSSSERARWQGYNFFFRNGFCWSDVLNPNSTYIKCRIKDRTVNDVKSMSLYESTGVGDEYLVASLNSYLFFKMLREFMNGTVAIQLNDIRKLPIKMPDAATLARIRGLVAECVAIKEQYFSGQLERPEALEALRPHEREVDAIINKLYGISAVEEVPADALVEEEIVEEEVEDE